MLFSLQKRLKVVSNLQFVAVEKFNYIEDGIKFNLIANLVVERYINVKIKNCLVKHDKNSLTCFVYRTSCVFFCCRKD